MSSVCLDKRQRDDVFSSSPLVAWIRSYVGVNDASNVELSNGLLLNDVLNHIDPNAFSDLHIQYGIHDVTSRAHNLVEIFNGVKRFYQEKLHQLVVMKVPDMLLLAREANNESSYSEMNDILLLILGCAIQCERKQEFIEHIKQLDVDVQRGLVLSIQEITENPDIVIPYRLNELGDMSRDELLIFCENMYGHLHSVMEQRDDYIDTVIDYVLFRDNEQYNDNRRNSVNQRRSSITQPTIPYSNTIQAEKERINNLQSELDDQNVLMADMKGELDQLKIQFESIRIENKHLKKEAALTKTYRDELDVLKTQVEDSNKLKNENEKLKDIAEEVEGFKKKCEEMQEQATSLFKQKISLDEQVRECTSKMHKFELLESENEKLCAQVNLLLEEQNEDQKHIRDLLDQVAKLSVEKQESMSTCATLTAELKRVQNETNNESNVPFMVEFNHSADLLRLEEENSYLQSMFSAPDVSFDNLQTQSPKIPQNIMYYKNLIASLIRCLASDTNQSMCDGIEDDNDISTVIRNKNIRDSSNNINNNNVDKLTTVVQQWANDFTRKGVNIDASKIMEEFHSLPRKNADPNNENLVEEADAEIDNLQKTIDEKEKRIIELEMRLNGVNELTQINERMKNDISQKEEKMRRLESRVDQLNELSRIHENREASNLKKVIDEVNRLMIANSQLQNQLVTRDETIEQLRVSIELMIQRSPKRGCTNDQQVDGHCERRIKERMMLFEHDEMENKIFCKDRTMIYLKESLDNLSNVSDSSNRMNEDNLSGREKKIAALKDNLNRAKELRYINEQLKDIMSIKEQKVTRIKEGLVRINDRHDETPIADANDEELNFHLRETVSNITELTELNSVLRGTLVVEDRTIVQLTESVANMEESAIAKCEMQDANGNEVRYREGDDMQETDVEYKVESLQDVLKLTNTSVTTFNFKDYF